MVTNEEENWSEVTFILGKQSLSVYGNDKFTI